MKHAHHPSICRAAWLALSAALFLAGPAAADPVTDARAALTAAPHDPAAYEALGKAQLKAGDVDGAIATYRALVDAVPDYDRGRYRLAFALRKADRLGEAADAYRAYIERAPNDPDARFGLAKTLERAGDDAGALDAYRAYVRLEVRPSEAEWVERARAQIAAFEAAGEGSAPPPAAQPPAAQPPAISPSAPAPKERVELIDDGERVDRAEVAATAEITLLDDTLIGRTAPAADADAAFEAGRYPEAAAAYVAALAARPDDPGLHHRAAVAAALAGDFVTAEHYAGRAVLLDPGNPPAADLARAAHAHRLRVATSTPVEVAQVERALRDGRLRTAARLAADALAADPTPAARISLLRLRGRALATLGRGDDAFAALKAAAAMQPPSVVLWAELATIAAQRGDREAADAFRGIAVRVADPLHPLADPRPR